MAENPQIYKNYHEIIQKLLIWFVSNRYPLVNENVSSKYLKFSGQNIQQLMSFLTFFVYNYKQLP